MIDRTVLEELIKHNPIRFEIVTQRMYNVYGFEKDSTTGILYGSYNTKPRAIKRLQDLEIYYGVTK